jgi:photosystem II stability/assembly factor-like uncharacterized protein
MNPRARTRLAVFILAFSLGTSASAGVNQWTIVGPPVSVEAMAVDPHNDNILYAAGYETTAKTVDGGATWTVTPLPELIAPTVIRVSASLPSTLYVLGLSELFRSTSAGVAWSKRKLPSAAQFPSDLQVHRTNADALVVAAANFCFFGCTGGGVFRSDDGGGSWKGIGLKNKDIYHVAFDPNTTKTIYATSMFAVFRTTNGGDSWREITLAGSGSVRDVAVDPIIPGMIYAATDAGVFRSSDLGQTWVLARPSMYGSAIATPAYAARQLFVSSGGPALSFDAGSTWQELSTANSGFSFRRLWQIAVSRTVCYLVSDLDTASGQILGYELQMPRRRTATR